MRLVRHSQERTTCVLHFVIQIWCDPTLSQNFNEGVQVMTGSRPLPLFASTPSNALRTMEISHGRSNLRCGESVYPFVVATRFSWSKGEDVNECGSQNRSFVIDENGVKRVDGGYRGGGKLTRVSEGTMRAKERYVGGRGRGGGGGASVPSKGTKRHGLASGGREGGERLLQ